MTSASAAAERPKNSRAVSALLVALLAFALALYGSLLSESHIAGSRLNEARNALGAAFTHDSEAARNAVAVVAYGLPFVLGAIAVVLGGRATRVLERQPGDRIGHLAAVFAVMVGSLTMVVSCCMTFAVYGWRHVPGYYIS